MLPTCDIVHISANMGVNINHDDFETFELIRDLEKARDDLYMKQCENNKTYQTETVEIVGNNSNLLKLEWLNEESSEPEDFLLVESRKRRRENKKIRRYSPLVRNKKLDQEDPGQPKKRRPCKANPSQNSKSRKK